MALYYVSPTGSNAANGNSLATAWQTIAFAVGATSPVVGGDTIYVRSGIPYTQYCVIGRPGAAGNPITVDTYPGDMPVKAQITTGGVLGGVYNAIASSWTFKNIEISNTVGGAGFYFDDAPGLGVNNVWTIDRCNIHHNLSGDNASGIFIQRQRGTINITNNSIHDNIIDPPNATSGYNATGVVVFGFINPGSPGLCKINFQHNEVYNQAVGFKIKHLFASDNVFQLEVAYNLFYSMTGRACCEVAGTDSTHTNVGNSKRVHHNLLINSPNGPALKSAADFGDWDTEWDHNTVYNCEAGFVAHREDASNESHRSNIHDNIWLVKVLAAPPVGYGVSLETTVAPLNVFDYNNFWNLTPTTTVATISGVGNQNLAGWQASTNNPDPHGTRVDPLFVDRGTGGKTGDFHLQVGSTLRNTGSNGNDKGCYELRTEIMGPLADDVTPPVLSNPYPAPGDTLIAGLGTSPLLITTDENATVKFSTTPGVSYDAMPNIFATTGGISHNSGPLVVVDGQSYTYYLRARDAAGNTNTSDFVIFFNVAGGVTPPVTPPASSGTLGIGVPTSLKQNVAYTLPGRVVTVMSTTSVETSLDGVTWTPLASATTGAKTGASFIRSPNAACIVVVKTRKR